MGKDQKTVMVSACLLGINCRFDGFTKEVPELRLVLNKYRLVPFCPETAGGLTIPRPPAEVRGGDGQAVLAGKAKVIDSENRDCTSEFILGAQTIWQLFKETQPEFVVCKARSPSCGVSQIYDGSFSGTLVPGDGVTVTLLRQAGASLFTEDDLLASDFGNE